MVLCSCGGVFSLGEISPAFSYFFYLCICFFPYFLLYNDGNNGDENSSVIIILIIVMIIIIAFVCGHLSCRFIFASLANSGGIAKPCRSHHYFL